MENKLQVGLDFGSLLEGFCDDDDDDDYDDDDDDDDDDDKRFGCIIFVK